MNVFNAIIGTLKSESQQQQQQQTNQANDQPWLITTAARSIGSIAGVGM